MEKEEEEGQRGTLRSWHLAAGRARAAGPWFRAQLAGVTLPPYHPSLQPCFWQSTHRPAPLQGLPATVLGEAAGRGGPEAGAWFPALELDLHSLDEIPESQQLEHQGLRTRRKGLLALASLESTNVPSRQTL